MSNEILSIMTVTYDRFFKYIRCIRSIKPYLSDKVKLEIVVDSKLGAFKFKIKKILTELILGNSNYIMYVGSDCIGKSRDLMLTVTESKYALICDDDDTLEVTNMDTILAKLEMEGPNIINFDYYPNNISDEFIEGYLKIRNWFGTIDFGFNVGTSTIFKVNAYRKLVRRVSDARFKLSYVDDLLPFHLLYNEYRWITKYKGRVIRRGRSGKSLMNSSNFDKLYEIIYSLKILKSYYQSRDFEIVLDYQSRYHELKSGKKFADLIKLALK